MSLRQKFMNNTSEQVAKLLLEINAITLRPKKPYRYVSGMLGPIYIDNRLLMSYPKERRIVRDLFIDAIKSTEENFDLIAATATAGIPHGAWIADKMNLPMVYVRGKTKEHGKGNQIEGLVKKGQNTAVIEDLITTGESAITTAAAVRNVGGKASFVFAIFTYGTKKSEENFKNNQLELIALSDLADIVEVAGKMGQITKEEKEIILDWIQNPATWGKRMGFE